MIYLHIKFNDILNDVVVVEVVITKQGPVLIFPYNILGPTNFPLCVPATVIL